MSKNDRRPSHPTQPRHAAPTRPNAPAAAATAPIVPPAVPPAPPTQAEKDLMGQQPPGADPAKSLEQQELDDVKAFEAEQRKQIEDGEKSQAIVDQERVADASTESTGFATPFVGSKIEGKPIDTTKLPGAQQVGADRLQEQGRPLTDTTHVEDLDDRTLEQKQTDEALLQHALDEEAAGRGEKIEDRRQNAVVLIHNTEGRVCSIALPHVEGASKRNRATHASVTLLPGVSPVSLIDWRLALKQKMVQLHVQEGHFVELDANSIADLPDKKALELIDLTVHRPLLLDWADQEKRPRVRTAIASQLEKIAPTKPKKDRDEDEDEDQE